MLIRLPPFLRSLLVILGAGAIVLGSDIWQHGGVPLFMMPGAKGFWQSD